MKNLTLLPLAAAALLALSACGEQAAEANNSAADANATVANEAAPADANASGDNYGSLISALQTGTSADLTAVTDTTTITFVTVSSLKANGDAAALDNALDKNAEAHAKLTADVTANATLSTKLTDAGYTAEQVVAIVAAADGSLTVYVDDRA